MKIRILDEAISDLRLGAQFYEKQSDGLGTYFLDTLFSDIESLHLYAGVHIQIEGFYPEHLATHADHPEITRGFLGQTGASSWATSSALRI